MHDTRRIAVCGKGGVGKTSLAALMVDRLAANDAARKILAIDADPACGLALALGVDVTKTVDDIRKSMVERSRKRPGTPEPLTLRQLEYELTEALHEGPGFSLLSIGRPEDEGCFCRVNTLLKDIIAEIAGSFDVVVIDGEAGVEQINRRVMKSVDHLVVVTDVSAKGVGVASTIIHLARDNAAVDCKEAGLVINRVHQEHEVRDIASRLGVPLWGWLPEDPVVREIDFRGEPIRALDGSSPFARALDGVLVSMGFSAGHP